MVEKRHVEHFVKAWFRDVEGKLWSKLVTGNLVSAIHAGQFAYVQLNTLLAAAGDARGGIVMGDTNTNTILLVDSLSMNLFPNLKKSDDSDRLIRSGTTLAVYD